MSNADVIIVGAGPTGLCAGALLANAGKKVLIFEKSGRVGGRMHSTTYKGHIFDNAPHLPCRTGHLERIFKDIGKPYPSIYYDWKGVEVMQGGKWSNLMSLLDRKKLREMLKEIVSMSYQELEQYDSMLLKDWVAARCDTEEMHLFWLNQATGAYAGAAYEDFGAGELLFFLKEQFDVHGGFGGLWGVVEGGYSSLYKPLYDAIIEKGGEVRFNTPVTEIIIEDGKAVGVEIPVEEQVVPSHIVATKVVKAPHVICNVALWDLFKVLPTNKLPKWYVDQINGIKWRWGASNPIVCGMKKEPWSHEWGKWVPWDQTKSRLNIWAHVMPGYGGKTGEVQVVFWFLGSYYDYPTSIGEASDPELRRQLKATFAVCEQDIDTFFPNWREHLVWKTYHWGPFGLAAMPGVRGTQAAPTIEVPEVKNLYLVNESVREARGITIQALARCARLCTERILGAK